LCHPVREALKDCLVALLKVRPFLCTSLLSAEPYSDDGSNDGEEQRSNAKLHPIPESLGRFKTFGRSSPCAETQPWDAVSQGNEQAKESDRGKGKKKINGQLD
jgi:hypothetical protein